jgi:ribosomal protein S12 methylthiotransferase accessory factor
MPALGISRITDISRLDRLGLPVYSSVRPRGRSLRVHAGKGLIAIEAQAGALAEAIEYAVAERDARQGPESHSTWGELTAQLPPGLSWDDFAPRLDRRADPKDAIEAAECEDIATSAASLLPCELLFLPDFSLDQGGIFGRSSNGLACGNSLDEATLHGLIEVLERDAVSMNLARDESRLLDNAFLPQPFAELARHWQALGIDLYVRDMPNDFGLPCFQAHLHEAQSFDVNLAQGAGAHLDPHLALARAITEAAQSRLTIIHGARDDVTTFYAKYRSGDPESRARADAQRLARVRDRTRVIRFEDVPGLPLIDPRQALHDLLKRLAGLGFGSVMRRRHRRGCERLDMRGLHVVKIVVPRCEDISHGGRRMGPRLKARVLAAA